MSEEEAETQNRVEAIAKKLFEADSYARVYEWVSLPSARRERYLRLAEAVT